ncbi:hypothetical protein [Mesorhizobium australicum]|uniref:hypothetical protein n=1 Tax=Mesorhizobium australicum TaxID=536018 RepID=UPI00333E04E4
MHVGNLFHEGFNALPEARAGQIAVDQPHLGSLTGLGEARIRHCDPGPTNAQGLRALRFALSATKYFDQLIDGWSTWFTGSSLERRASQAKDPTRRFRRASNDLYTLVSWLAVVISVIGLAVSVLK